jgi:hypothetical protein
VLARRQHLVRFFTEDHELVVSENAIACNEDIELSLRVRMAEDGVSRRPLGAKARVGVSAALREVISNPLHSTSAGRRVS